MGSCKGAAEPHLRSLRSPIFRNNAVRHRIWRTTAEPCNPFRPPRSGSGTAGGEMEHRCPLQNVGDHKQRCLIATYAEQSTTCDASAMSIVFQAMNRTLHTEMCPRCRASSARITHQNLVFYCENCGHSWLDVITSPQADRRESSMPDRRRASRTNRRGRDE